MSIPKLVWLLVPMIALTACGSSGPLEEEIASDFLLIYHIDRQAYLATEPGEAQAPARPAPKAEPVDGPQVSEAVKKGELPPGLSLARLSLDNTGVVKFDVKHAMPGPAERKGEIKLEPDDVGVIYNALRALEPFSLEDAYEGGFPKFGTTIWEVISRNEYKRIEVKETEVPALDEFRKVLLATLPSGDIIDYPPPEKNSVVMDTRNREFFRWNDPRVKQIPAGDRKEYSTANRALDDNGWPAEGFEFVEDE